MGFFRFAAVLFLVFSVGCTAVGPKKSSYQNSLAPAWANKQVRVIGEPDRRLFVGLATEAGNEDDVKRLALRNSVELLMDHLGLTGFSIADESWLESVGGTLELVGEGGGRRLEINGFVQIDGYTECENVLGKRIYEVFVLTAVPGSEIERLQSEIKSWKNVNPAEGGNGGDAK